MSYLVTINSNHFEIDNNFKKIIRSFFQERMTDFVTIHNDTESSLTVFINEDLPSKIQTELTAYFNIKLKVFKINQPNRTFDFQQLGNVVQFEKDMVGMYLAPNKTTYPYLQFGRRIYFLNPVGENFPNAEYYHTTASKGYDFPRSTNSKKVEHQESDMKFYFDYVKDITKPFNFIYDLFQMKKSPYLNLDEFHYSRGNQGHFDLFYDSKAYKIIVSIMGIKNDSPYGDIYLVYHNIQPFKSKAYTKKRKDALGEYFIELTRKEEALYSWHRPYLNITSHLISIEGIDLHNSDYYALIGCLLDRYDESIIPVCFDKQNIKESYERFQSFETLYQIKNGHKISA